MAELAESFRQIAVVGGAIQLVTVAVLGLIAVRQRSQDETPSDLTALFPGDTVQFSRQYSGRRRASRSWPRTVQHRRPVCRRRVSAGQRDTVRVAVYDPPEGGGPR